jgi:hypothetical protein
MTRTVKITFLGPLAYQRKKNAKGGKGAGFSILQQGGALKLEYPSMEEAISARRTVLGDHHSHAVPSNKLLGAIHTALEQAKDPDHHDQDSTPGAPYLDVPTPGHAVS